MKFRTHLVAALAAGLAATSLALVSPGATSAALTAPGRAGGFDPADFETPRTDSMPAIYWYWGGVITDEIIGFQMEQMREKGIDEFVLFPFNGADMVPKFATEDWFDRVEFTIREAARTGMRVWIFNDDNFPSGRGASFVVNGGQLGDRTLPARPDLRLKGLWRSTAVVDGGTSVPLDRSSGVATDDGRLAVDGQVLEGGAPLRVGTQWSDYTVSGNDVRFSGTSGGIMVRASADGRSGYVVEIDARGIMTVTRLDNGVRTLISTGAAVPGFTYQRPRKISVQVSGSTITPLLDGKPQPTATVTDTTYATGTVAPYDTGSNRTLWGDLTVTDPGGATLWGADFESSDALAAFEPTMTLRRAAVAAVARPAGSKDADQLVELTPRLDGEGRPVWQAPAGRWQVDLFGGMPLIDDSRGYTRGYLDLLDEEATDAFMDTIPAEYVRRFGWAMGTTVPGFWDDEPFIALADPHPFKRQPWSPTLAAELADVGATPGLAYVSAFDDLGRAGRQLRGQYWQAVNNRYSEAYYKRQSEWMAEHGLQMISNPLWDETQPSRRMGNTGDLTKDNQWAQVPGTDLITADYTPGKQSSLVRNAGSVAHQSGQERVVLESFGNAGWKIAPDFMRSAIGVMATRGANQIYLHAMWTDEARVIFPPPFGPRSTFWDDMDDVDAWIGRVMEIARGDDESRTALVQPQQAAQQHFRLAKQAAVDEHFEEAGFALERSQVDFDLVTDGALWGDPAVREHALVRGSSLVVGDADYQHVVLPETPVLDLESVRLLQRFVREGGDLVVVGGTPEEETRGRDAALADAFADLLRGGGPGAGSATVVADEDAAAELVADQGGAALETSAPVPSLRVARRSKGKDLAYLINNESDQSVSTRAVFPTTSTPELWDPRTGSHEQADVWSSVGGGTSVQLDLGPYETLAVVFPRGAAATPHLTAGDVEVLSANATSRTLTADVVADRPGTYELRGADGATTYAGTVEVRDSLEPLPLAGPWTVKLEKEGAVAEQRPLGSWVDFAPTFSGSAVYATSLDLTAADLADRRLVLDLGDVREIATVTVNGTELPTALWKPYVVDVTSALRVGSNSIEVRVTNTLANERNQKVASGLLGPVSLRPQAVVTATMARTR